MDVFFSDEDRRAYLELLAAEGAAHGIDYLAWCLMTNHIHLICVPVHPGSLAAGIGEAHKLYTRRVNFREGWRGFLFQGRFFSCPIEPSRLAGAVRYVLQNPVRAGLVKRPWDYAWSSSRWLVGVRDRDPLVREMGPLEEVADWRTVLAAPEEDLTAIRQHTRTGRPFGDKSFVAQSEVVLGRRLQKRRPGPSPRR
jgi:putative transposase